jgi:plastocyanin
MRWLPPALLTFLAALAGCGGGEDPPERTVTLPAGEPARVVAGEYFFDPERVVVTRGPADLRIVLDNQGDLAHNIVVFDGEREVGGLPSFPGGESRSTEVRVAPGTYRLVCTVADHEELGMVGELRVRE